jgi:hypothetical protein
MATSHCASSNTMEDAGERSKDHPPSYQDIVSDCRMHCRLALDTLPLTVLQHIVKFLSLSALATMAVGTLNLGQAVCSTTDPFIWMTRRGNEFERARFIVSCFDKHYPNYMCTTDAAHSTSDKHLKPAERSQKRISQMKCSQVHRQPSSDSHFRVTQQDFHMDRWPSDNAQSSVFS